MNKCQWRFYCLTHEWDEGVVAWRPNHDVEGAMDYTCIDCGEERREPIPILPEHNYTTETFLPTCTKDGFTEYTCTICDYSYTGDIVPTPGHGYTEWVSEGTPTCTEGCSEHRSCTVCGKEEKRAVPALGHDWETVVTPPTCLEWGGSAHTCLRCGKESNSDPTRPTGHVYGEWFVDTPPTCDKAGYEVQVCSVCGKENKKWLSSLGHEYEDTVVEPTCTEGGYTLHTCAVCGHSYKDNILPPGSHSFGAWVTVTPATCADEGLERRSCAACGEDEERTLATLEHSYQTSVVEPTCTAPGYTNHTCTVCGRSYTDTVVTALGHIPGETIKTNQATDGSYDLQVCCVVCQNVISTIHVEGSKATPGDVDDDGSVDVDDAIYLLFHLLIGDIYPVDQSCDFDGSGTEDVDDAIYLLFHILIGSDLYPLK